MQARLGWAVGWKKPPFWGREILVAERAAGPVGWHGGGPGSGYARPHMHVMGAGSAQVGEVTSGTFSPTRRIGIGLALLDSHVSEGDEVSVDVRGRASRMRVVKPPFVQPSAAS